MTKKINWNALERVFRAEIKGKSTDFEDPDPKRTPSKVLEFIANEHPELVNCTVDPPVNEDGKLIYYIKTS